MKTWKMFGSVQLSKEDRFNLGQTFIEKEMENAPRSDNLIAISNKIWAKTCNTMLYVNW